MLYLVIFILFAALVAILLLIKINILIEYVRSGWDDHIVLSVFALRGLLKYKYELPLVDLKKSGIRFKKVKEKGPKEKDVDKGKGHLRFFELFEKIMDMKDLYEENRKLICDIQSYLKGRLVLKEFKLEMDIGTGDASRTGILSGLVWAVAGIITAFISKGFKVLKKDVRVKTNFVEKEFNIDLYCIFDVKIVHIIVVGLKILISKRLTSIIKMSRNFKGGGIVG